MSIVWNTGLAAERARHNLKLKKKKAAGRKRQAASSKLQAREDIIYEENERLLDRSCKRQASSTKELDSHKIPDIK